MHESKFFVCSKIGRLFLGNTYLGTGEYYKSPQKFRNNYSIWGIVASDTVLYCFVEGVVPKNLLCTIDW